MKPKAEALQWKLYLINDMRKTFLAILILILAQLGFQAFAAESPAPPQRVTVTGLVLDDTDLPIPGAAVMVRGSSRGVITDEDGRFAIEVSPHDVLIFQFLGFEDEEIKVGDQLNFVVKMRTIASSLEEVTVVAYGAQRKASVIGAISTVSADQLKTGVGQVSSSLAGKMAGLVVLQRTGEPGAGADFWIRGISTFGGSSNTPLILVDGVERSLDLVDADDIASFSILKDATATALYGVRGANGIVIVTTKRGGESAPKVSMKVEFGATQPIKIPQMANTAEWIDFFNQVNVDSGNVAPIDDYRRELYINSTANVLGYDSRTGYDSDLYPSVDWVKTIYKDMATTRRYNVSVSGGTKMVRYYVAGSYYFEDSILNNDNDERYDASLNYRKFNFRANTDINITRSTELGISLSTQYNIKNQPASTLQDIYTYTLLMTPIAIPTHFSDGTLSRALVGHNPWNDLNAVGYSNNDQITAQSMVSLTQHFDDFAPWLQGLTANAKFSWDAWNSSTLTRGIYPSIYRATGRATEADDDGNYPLLLEQVQEGSNYMGLSTGHNGTMTINGEASLNYERIFGGTHRVSGLLLFNIRNHQALYPGSYIYAFPYRYIGLAGRLTYSFKDRYFTEVNFGYNGSENFAPAHRMGFFPSVAVAWRMSEEEFMQNAEWLTNLKWRLSYGVTGNNSGIGNYDTQQTVAGPTYYPFGATYFSAYYPNAIIDSNLEWETSYEWNAGVDFGFIRDRITGTFDFYNKTSDNLLYPVELPLEAGGGTLVTNVGSVLNRGVEFGLKTVNIDKNGWYWETSLTLAHNHNEVLEINGSGTDLPGSTPTGGLFRGHSVNNIYGYDWTGIVTNDDMVVPNNEVAVAHGFTPGETVRESDYYYACYGLVEGNPIIDDVNGDGKFTDEDKKIWSADPKLTASLTSTLMWKGIEFAFTLYGKWGQKAYSNFYSEYLNYADRGRQKVAMDYYIPAGTLIDCDGVNANGTYINPVYQETTHYGTFPFPSNAGSSGGTNSSYWLENAKNIVDASYLKVKNITLAYNFQKPVLNKLHIQKLRLYCTVTNPFCFSSYLGFDPEWASAQLKNDAPATINTQIGLNLKF